MASCVCLLLSRSWRRYHACIRRPCVKRAGGNANFDNGRFLTIVPELIYCTVSTPLPLLKEGSPVAVVSIRTHGRGQSTLSINLPHSIMACRSYSSSMACSTRTHLTVSRTREFVFSRHLVLEVVFVTPRQGEVCRRNLGVLSTCKSVR